MSDNILKNLHNPTHFFINDCHRVAHNCGIVIKAEYDGFSATNESYFPQKRFPTVETLYAFLVGFSLCYNKPR